MMSVTSNLQDVRLTNCDSTQGSTLGLIIHVSSLILCVRRGSYFVPKALVYYEISVCATIRFKLTSDAQQ